MWYNVFGEIMRLRNVRGANERIEASQYMILDYKKMKGNYKQLFNNNNPIHIEIGMGKGMFILNKAKANPDINFIGIEKFDSVIVRAIEKIEHEDLPNLRLIRMDATEIADIFDHEIDTIYLNFSDPWPKARHEHRRLSSQRFLQRYDTIFKDKKKIIMKTDNRHLFEFSVKEFTRYGYQIDDLCLNIYDEKVADNIPTEYELKFASRGFPIYSIAVSKR